MKGLGNTFQYKILGFGYNDISPVMTDLNLPAPYVVTASHTYSTNYAWYAFDITNTNGWLAQRTTTSNLKVDMGSAIVANAVMLRVNTVAR